MRARRSELASATVDGQLVVLDLRSAEYLKLNRSGVILWEALQRGCTLDGLVDELQKHYDVDVETATTDVDAFLVALYEHNMVEGVAPEQLDDD